MSRWTGTASEGWPSSLLLLAGVWEGDSALPVDDPSPRPRPKYDNICMLLISAIIANMKFDNIATLEDLDNEQM